MYKVVKEVKHFEINSNLIGKCTYSKNGVTKLLVSVTHDKPEDEPITISFEDLCVTNTDEYNGLINYFTSRIEDIRSIIFFIQKNVPIELFPSPPQEDPTSVPEVSNVSVNDTDLLELNDKPSEKN